MLMMSFFGCILLGISRNEALRRLKMPIIWVKEELFKLNFYEKNKHFIGSVFGNNLHN